MDMNNTISNDNQSRVKRWKENNREHWRELKRIQSLRRTARKNGISLEEHLALREAKLKNRETNDIELVIKKRNSKKCPLLKANRKIDYIVNREEYLAKSKSFYYKNHEKSLLKVRNWRHTNRQSKYEQDKRRNELKSKGYISLEDWKAVKAMFDNRCAYCLGKAKLTQDHFIPLSKGGEHSIDNIVPACNECNASKGAKSYIIWIKS